MVVAIPLAAAVPAASRITVVRILTHAIRLGVTHIETAKAYGCSELQLGDALQHIFHDKTLAITRKDLIVQTKGAVIIGGTKEDYKITIREQLQRLQLDYVDLFIVHGINMEAQLDALFGATSNQFAALEGLRTEGRIRHIVFFQSRECRCCHSTCD